MELITLGILALAAGLGGAAARVVARRRRAKKIIAPQLPDPQALVAAVDPLAALPLRLGDVVQCGDATRWPDRGIVVRQDGSLHAAIWLSEEDGEEQATVAMAPPSHDLLWLVRRPLALPPKAPNRLEIDGMLLDREQCFPAELELRGEVLEVDEAGVFALYRGSAGTSAVVLQAGGTFVWYGERIGPGDFDNLGQVERDET
ncbi:MAG: hypothetical protein R3B72_03075 [Polyangiaceae bacterium]